MQRSMGQLAVLISAIYDDYVTKTVVGRATGYLGLYFPAAVFQHMLKQDQEQLDVKSFLDLSFELINNDALVVSEYSEEDEPQPVRCIIYRLPDFGYIVVERESRKSGDLFGVTIEVVDAVEELLSCL